MGAVFLRSEAVAMDARANGQSKISCNNFEIDVSGASDVVTVLEFLSKGTSLNVRALVGLWLIHLLIENVVVHIRPDRVATALRRTASSLASSSSSSFARHVIVARRVNEHLRWFDQLGSERVIMRPKWLVGCVSKLPRELEEVAVRALTLVMAIVLVNSKTKCHRDNNTLSLEMLVYEIIGSKYRTLLTGGAGDSEEHHSISILMPPLLSVSSQLSRSQSGISSQLSRSQSEISYKSGMSSQSRISQSSSFVTESADGRQVVFTDIASPASVENLSASILKYVRRIASRWPDKIDSTKIEIVNHDNDVLIKCCFYIATLKDCKTLEFFVTDKSKHTLFPPMASVMYAYYYIQEISKAVGTKIWNIVTNNSGSNTQQPSKSDTMDNVATEFNNRIRKLIDDIGTDFNEGDRPKINLDDLVKSVNEIVKQTNEDRTELRPGDLSAETKKTLEETLPSSMNIVVATTLSSLILNTKITDDSDDLRTAIEMFDRIVRMTGHDIFNTPNDNSNTFSPVTSTTKNTTRLVTRSNSNHNTDVPGVQINIASTDKNAKSNKTILVPTQLTMRGIKQKPLNSSPKVLKLSNDKNVPNSSQVQKVIKYHTSSEELNYDEKILDNPKSIINLIKDQKKYPIDVHVISSNSYTKEQLKISNDTNQQNSNTSTNQQTQNKSTPKIQQQTRKEEVFSFEINENTRKEDFIEFYVENVPFINGKRNYNVLKFKKGSEELNYDEKILDNPKSILTLIKEQNKYPIDVHVIRTHLQKEQLNISNDKITTDFVHGNQTNQLNSSQQPSKTIHHPTPKDIHTPNPQGHPPTQRLRPPPPTQRLTPPPTQRLRPPPPTQRLRPPPPTQRLRPPPPTQRLRPPPPQNHPKTSTTQPQNHPPPNPNTP